MSYQVFPKIWGEYSSYGRIPSSQNRGWGEYSSSMEQMPAQKHGANSSVDEYYLSHERISRIFVKSITRVRGGQIRYDIILPGIIHGTRDRITTRSLMRTKIMNKMTFRKNEKISQLTFSKVKCIPFIATAIIVAVPFSLVLSFSPFLALSSGCTYMYIPRRMCSFLVVFRCKQVIRDGGIPHTARSCRSLGYWQMM